MLDIRDFRGMNVNSVGFPSKFLLNEIHEFRCIFDEINRRQFGLSKLTDVSLTPVKNEI